MSKAYHHDVAITDWKKLGLIPDVETAWTVLSDGSKQLVNKHAPLRRYREKKKVICLMIAD